MKNKRGQYRIQQMAFMLVALFIFMILAGMFFLWLYLNNARKSAAKLEENNALLAAQFISKTPELECGDNCIDTDRVMLLIDRTFYKNFWDFKSLEIRKVYPAEIGKKCTPATYPNCDSYSIFDLGNSEKKISSFVALCRKEIYNGGIIKRCELGKIIIGV